MYDRRRLVESLQRALRLGRWSEVQAVVEQLRGGAASDRSDWRNRLLPFLGRRGANVSDQAKPRGRQAAERKPAAGSDSPTGRFILWVDSVGGFLVCMADRVTLGQSLPSSLAGPDDADAKSNDRIEVPILGDLSRRHAVIRRDAEGYWVEPLRETRLDGRGVAAATTLDDGRVIELGAVRLRFRRPHPLSATARLEPVSHHRTHPHTDGVLLMADTCILSADNSSHVQIPDLSGQVILFREGEGLACSAPGELEIDGKKHSRRGPVRLGSHVAGEDFSFSLEAV
jgi:hypothetical protein